MIGGVPWRRAGCLTIIVFIALGFLALNELVGNAGGDVLVDGIKCGAGASDRHVHAHLALYDSGRHVFMHDGIGMSREGSCWYWLHMHDASGIIHVEGPSSFHPTLGQFFDIWHQPLSATRFFRYKGQSSESMRVYVDQQLYTRNPRDISLRRHTTITLEIGPPYQQPRKYNFGSL